MDATIDIAAWRRYYAEELRAASRLESDPLVDAFSRVPREHFLGPGPWQIPILDLMEPRGGGYYTTKDADPRRVHHNIAVALDPARQLNNGHPGSVATWIEWLAIQPRDRIVHIGAGTGYYTAILAELCGADGRVFALEADAVLAARARENLREWPQVEVVHGDATTVPAADAIFVNAGATFAPDAWLDGLADGGRMILPVTASFGHIGKGAIVRITREGSVYRASAGGLVAIYNCTTARDDSMAPAIGKAMMTGGFSRVRELRRDPHAAGESCVVHRDGCCLSAGQ
jgi:protein-L-isoaspartate(D-aspartate) O-methyltransferase